MFVNVSWLYRDRIVIVSRNSGECLYHGMYHVCISARTLPLTYRVTYRTYRTLSLLCDTGALIQHDTSLIHL